MKQQSEAVLRFMVANSLYGQTYDTLRDIKKLVDPEANGPLLEELLRTHQLAHYATVKHESGAKFTLAPFLQIREGLVHLPSKAVALRLSPDYSEVLEVVEQKDELSPEQRAFLTALEKEMQEYLRRYFKEGASFVCEFDEDGGLTFALSCKNVNLENYQYCCDQSRRVDL